MLSRIVEILRKEILVTFRDPRMRVMLFLPPMVQLIIFGYAVNLDVEHSRLGWLDRDRTPESRELAAAFQGSPYFEIASLLDDGDDVNRVMERGEVIAVVSIQPGFARDLRRGRPAVLQVVIDGTDSNTASIVSSYIGGVTAAFGSRLRRRGAMVAKPAAGTGPAVSVRSRVWFNESLRSQDYFVPGVLVNIVGLVTVMLTAMAVVREKEIGTMEQLMVTPIRPVELMLGKTLPFAAVGLVQMILVTGVALLVFHIPFRGDPWILLLSSLLFVMTTLGSGLLISTVSGTQQQAMMGSFFFFFPAFLLSGFAFPIGSMPRAIQILTYLNPMRYFIEIVRGLFLKGIGIPALWPQLLALTAFGFLTVGASALRFRKRID